MGDAIVGRLAIDKPAIERLWKTGEYVSWVETRWTKASVGVHRALIRWTDGAVRDSHVKIVFSDGSKPCRQLVHEAIAWTLARAQSLPCPRFAGLMVLTPDEIARAHPERPRGGETAAWVTNTEVGTDMRDYSQAALQDQIRLWPDLAKACAFDIWLGNTDRYPRNLLRRGENDFVLIDHDQIAGDAHWTPSHLETLKQEVFDSALLRMCPDLVGAQFRGEMLKHSKTFPKTLRKAIRQVDDWLWRLLDEDDEVAALRSFITERAANAGKLIKSRRTPDPRLVN